jgi:catechol 2,3-dioxygenase-like lactoylglutathione lyase family enzyme
VTFRAPQVTLYATDLPRLVAFYEGLGFRERFRYPSSGEPEHVELLLDGFNLGVATVATARRDHGLSPNPGGGGSELVLWTDDVAAAVEQLVAAGATVVSPTHDWLDDLRLAWIADPEGNPIQIVQKRAS